MKKTLLLLCAICTGLFANNVEAVNLKVTVENIGPSNGVAITPVWAGFHDGSFDSYDGGTSASSAIENLAEDGNNAVISDDFNMVSGRRDILGIANGGPITPGTSASTVFTNIATDGTNRYFSYASMVLPSNDFFLANGNPTAHDLSSLYGGSGSVSFLIGTTGGGSSPVHDAGTEVEDFDFVAPPNAGLNGLFPGRSFDASAGQTAPNQGTDQLATISNVTSADPFGSFANILGADLTGFDFNDPSLYTEGGIARITIRAIPEPSSILLMGIGTIGLGLLRRYS